MVLALSETLKSYQIGIFALLYQERRQHTYIALHSPDMFSKVSN
jgi:hypothetical protein